MKPKIFAVFFAVLLAVSSALSLTAFAADDSGAGSSTGSEFLDSYFADWEEAGEQAIVLRDTYKQFLYNVCTGAGLQKILGDAKEIPIAWLRTTKAGVFALTPVDNIFYWLVNKQLVFDDRTSGESVKKNVDINAPTIYVPTPWIEYVKTSSGGETTGDQMTFDEVDLLNGIESIFTSAITVVTNFLSLLTDIFNFCVGNIVCLIFLAVTFVGIGIRYMRRVVGAFGRGR